MKKLLLIAVLMCVTAALSEPLLAGSDMFSVNFYGYGKGGADLWDQTSWRQTVTLEPGQSAGAGIWNTTDWVNLSTGDRSVVLTTALGYTPLYELNNVRNAGPYWRTQIRTILLGDGNGDLMDGHFNGTEDEYNGSMIFDMTVSNIPAYPSYDVIVYLRGNQAQWGNGKGKIVVNAGPAQSFTLQSGEFDGVYTEITDGTTPGDYMVFHGLTGSVLSLQVWGDGFNHIAPAGFQIYAADAGSNSPETATLLALTELKEHVQGTITLNDSEIADHKATIDADKTIFGTSENAMTSAFEYVEAYDAAIGPLWVDGVERWPGWDRRLVTDDIHWTTYTIMQYIMDYTYTAANLAANESLLGSFKFGSADYFPGHVDPPTDPEVTYTAKINASFPKTYGHDTMHWADRPARKCTGSYLAPGTIATVTVPSSMVNKGYQIRVGAHALDYKNKPFVKRLDRSSLAYDITSTETKVTNPLGGGIYIEVPYLADAGVADIQIKNTVRAPYYSYNTVTGDITTLSDWQNTERNFQAPWADFQSEKFMMQVPTSWIYALDDPVTLMANWDKAIDAANDLMGFDHDRGKESSYDQVDVLIDAGAYSPGYPTCNNTYNPRSTYNGYVNSYLVRGPQYAPSMHFHELGHGYLFQKFSGETESVVNLLHVPIWNRKFGYDLDMAFRSSRGFNNNQYITLDTTAICWMTCQNFKNNQPMTSSEKKYQLKGHAKFVEIARLFGWDVLGDYWRSFNDDYENGINWAKDDDSLLLRLSKAVGCDIRPLFHFWGVPPKNASSLQAAFAAENLPASNKIYDTLYKYKSLVPADNSEFQASLLNWYGYPPTSDGATTERDHAASWDIYDTSTAAITRDNVQNIIDLYFPEGRPGLDIGSDKITWSGKGVQMNPVFNGGYSAASFAWSAEPADGVVFAPNSNVESPTVTISMTASNPSVVTVKLITDGDAGVEEDTMTLDVYDDACKAAVGKGLSANHPADIDGNCIIDLHDFAILAATWLDDGALTGPMVKP